MSSLGYYVHVVDMSYWLTMAQKSLVVKNKVRKELWRELVDIIQWDADVAARRNDYIRISHSSFVAMQTFCLIDGKGADNVSSDQLLNFCTTLDDLRSRLTPQSFATTLLVPTAPPLGARSLVREHIVAQAVDVGDEEEEVEEPEVHEEKSSVPPALP